MRTSEEKAEHATYMREYYKDPVHKLKKKESDAKYYQNNKEVCDAKNKQYRDNLSDEQKVRYADYQLNYRKKHKQESKTYKQKYYAEETLEERTQRIKKDVERNKKNYQANPQPIRDYNNKQYEEKRLIVLNHYSPDEIKCARCGNNDIDMMTMDHVNDDGHEHRKTVKNLVPWLIKNSFPEGFQVLCMNCQFIKMSIVFYGDKSSYDSQYALKQKIKALTHYCNGDPYCVECGITDIRVLTADHIGGNGNEHRRSINVPSGLKFYRWLIRNNYPNGFQVLCMNHQIKKAKQNKENCGRPRLY